MNGLVCAGKKIHEILLDVGNVGVRDIAAKYVQECQLMSDLRHPNITQFLGLCFLPNCQLPVLVMEKLDGSLDDLLESVPNIPLALKRSMLEDVARGLLYLHNHDPQIIHRDLTAKNVLLTPSLAAKITDFGNSRIVNIQPGQLAQTLSRNPGTLVYMPPEALADVARYGPSMDIFSFGHLGIFVGLQVGLKSSILNNNIMAQPTSPIMLTHLPFIYLVCLRDSFYHRYFQGSFWSPHILIPTIKKISWHVLRLSDVMCTWISWTENCQTMGTTLLYNW